MLLRPARSACPTHRIGGGEEGTRYEGSNERIHGRNALPEAETQGRGALRHSPRRGPLERAHAERMLAANRLEQVNEQTIRWGSHVRVRGGVGSQPAALPAAAEPPA